MKIELYMDETRGDERVGQAVQEFSESEKRHGMPFIARVENIYFQRDNRGIYTELETFLGGLPESYRSLPVRMVSLYDEGSMNHPAEGVYKSKDAEATVDIFTKTSEVLEEIHKIWRIRILGKSFESVVALYRAIRSGKAKPEEAWIGEKAQKQPAPAKAG